MRTGATSMLPEPMKAPSSIDRRPFVGAVVIAGDGAGADVDVSADAGIAHVAQMIRLAARADLAVLHFDEVADVHAAVQDGSGPQAREGSDAAVLADRRLIDDAVREDLGVGADGWSCG